MLPFVFEAMPEPSTLTARGGLALVSDAMLAVGLEDVVGEELRLRTRRRG